MLDAYGRALVEERRRSHHLDGLATYVRLEYPRGTDPAYILTEVVRRGPRGKRRNNHLRGVLRTFRRILGALLHREQRGRKTELPQPVR